RPPATATLHCDASDTGWGGVLNHGERFAPAAGFWTPSEHRLHITAKELRAVRYTVAHFAPQLAGHRVKLHEDNAAVAWILTHL
ncbi:RNase H-like domain-containing protein, partial [Klebsiella pneumoniae]|uniref:RNase H-like domain-containing protein n=1 Tax=Klebsiella pneumoniae TaxID=573 RepID=UPI0025A1E142